MAKSVVGLFDTSQDAQGAVQELRNAGFGADDISVVANNARGEYNVRDGDSEAAAGAGAGATGGAVLGGLAGLLVGLGALAIPGVGPVVAAGTLATTLGTTAAGAGLGAAAGGLVGALVGAGIPENDANIYAEGVRRGGALVTVQAASDEDADRAADIMDRYNVVDIDERAASYRQGGWNNFDANAGAYEGSSDRSMAGGSSYGGTSDTARSDWQQSSKVGTAGGTAAGAATGAAVGSIGGPVGTAIGGVAGAVVGAGTGAAGDVGGERYSERRGGDQDNAGMSSTSAGARDTTAMGSATDYGTTNRDNVGYTSTGTTQSGTAGYQSGTQEIGRNEGETAIPVVREELRVGKREVEGGGARVTTEVTERPVEEQVTLRDETVNVERRPVDRPADASTIDAFKEGTFEVREREEQAVVEKQARVVEEVVINKEAQERTETVRDTARHTHVNVEEIPGETRSTGYTSTDTAGTSAAGTTAGGYQDVSSTGSMSSTRYEDLSNTGRTGGDEGAIERGVSKGENAVERGTGLDLDRDGDVGRRDPRDNVGGV